MSFFDFLKQPSVPVPRQDTPKYKDATEYLMATNPDFRRLDRTLKRQDKQFAAIQKAEAEYKVTGDLNTLITFWEKLLATDGILIPGASWPFKIVEVYYKAKRYDDAWRALSKLVLDPDYRKKARQWQIKILKKEKKDYSQIQHLLDTGQ